MFTEIFVYIFIIKSVVYVGKCDEIEKCNTHLYNYKSKNNSLHFTKELSSNEYAFLNKLKSLYCCSKGYESIVWYKDGDPYPWTGNISSFIIYPEAANQTIYTKSLSNVDAGVYSCLVTNGTYTMVNYIELTIFDSYYSNDPIITYELPAKTYVEEGDCLRLYCEAFIGKINLPDAAYHVSWNRISGNESMLLIDTRVKKVITSRDNELIVGSYLFIDKVTEKDFDEYICSISNADDQITQMKTEVVKKREEVNNYYQTNIPIFELAIIFSIIIMLKYVFSCNRKSILLYLWLIRRKFFQKEMKPDPNKTIDILLCYENFNALSNFFKKELPLKLQMHLGYTVKGESFNSPKLNEVAGKAHSVIILQTNEVLNLKELNELLDFFIKLSMEEIILIPLHPIPSKKLLKKTEEGAKFRNHLKKVTVIPYDPSDMMYFWRSLVLTLPIKMEDTELNGLPQLKSFSTKMKKAEEAV